MTYFKRHIEQKIEKAITSFSSIYINGPRQVGKTTLVKKLAKKFNAEYISFDDPFILAEAKASPTNFLSKYKNHVVFDEIQMVPELFRPLKIRIDENRYAVLQGKAKKQHLILTGSTNLMAVPKLADAMVGRMAIFTLYPISCNELTSSRNFIEYILENDPEIKSIESKYSADQMIEKASFPELSLSNNNDFDFTREWMADYIRTITERDVREISEIRKIDDFPRLLQSLASRVGGLLNDTDISRTLGIDKMTLKRYRILMELVFVILRISPWFSNIGKRPLKSPKLYFLDTRLLLSILNTTTEQIKSTPLYGHIIENFVCTEIIKQLSFISSAPGRDLMHYCTDNSEVDFILEKRFNEIIAIEVKAKNKIDINDIKNLKSLQQTAKDKFKKGLLFYNGNKVIPISRDIWAIPINSLWN